mmetsp:Transcript_20313/g.50528  ORF Transcript_20313/g.50528 Transcript_20313/m.50528 type:complete len:116 (+) Transcript_20313:759-1106(+)
MSSWAWISKPITVWNFGVPSNETTPVLESTDHWKRGVEEEIVRRFVDGCDSCGVAAGINAKGRERRRDKRESGVVPHPRVPSASFWIMLCCCIRQCNVRAILFVLSLDMLHSARF